MHSYYEDIPGDQPPLHVYDQDPQVETILILDSIEMDFDEMFGTPIEAVGALLVNGPPGRVTPEQKDPRLLQQSGVEGKSCPIDLGVIGESPGLSKTLVPQTTDAEGVVERKGSSHV